MKIWEKKFDLFLKTFLTEQGKNENENEINFLSFPRNTYVLNEFISFYFKKP